MVKKHSALSSLKRTVPSVQIPADNTIDRTRAPIFTLQTRQYVIW